MANQRFYSTTLKMGLCGLIGSIAHIASSPAQDAVYSVNIVGFQKVEAPPGFDLASIPFIGEDLGVNAVIGPQLTGGSGQGTSDNILLFDTSSQSYITLYRVNDVGDPEFNFKWISGSEVATNEIPPGTGFWVFSRRETNQVFTLVGDVVDAPEQIIPVANGLQLLAYPYSSSIPLNDTSLKDGAQTGMGQGTADNIIAWDSGEQTFKTFYILGDVGDPEFNHKWIDTSSGTVADHVLEPGRSFWYRHRSSGFSWLETKPYDEP